MIEAERLVSQAIERYGKDLAVACSFGKDSVVILHMALKYDPNVKVIFNNTGVEFQETIKYKELMKKLWKLNLIETKPYKKSFWDCIKEYGLPSVRLSRGARTPRCCYYCKEKPAQLIYKEHNIRAIMTGIMAEESQNRKLLFMRYSKNDKEFCGQRYYMKTWDLWKYHPIAYWKEKDVWDYIETYKIPINPVYTKWNGIYKRCGCLPCTAYLDWEKKLSKTHPSLYHQLKKIQCPTQTKLKCKSSKKKK